VLDSFLDLGDDDELAFNSDTVETFHFDAGKGEEVADFIESAGAEIEPFFEPIERDVHVAGRLCGDDGIFNGEMREISLNWAGLRESARKGGAKKPESLLDPGFGEERKALGLAATSA
jgi:hypothetical protein